MAETSACMAHFFKLLNVVNNPFSQRKESYSLLPVDGALSIPVTYYFEESVSCLNAYVWENSWRPFAVFELGSPLETILQSKGSTSELAGPAKLFCLVFRQ